MGVAEMPHFLTKNKDFAAVCGKLTTLRCAAEKTKAPADCRGAFYFYFYFSESGITAMPLFQRSI